MREFNHHFIATLTQLDYGRNVAFLALDQASGDILGVVRLHADPDHRNAEFAVIVRSDLKGHGLGTNLMKLAIRYGQTEGYVAITGQVLQENQAMLKLCRELGFEHEESDQDGIFNMRLVLRSGPERY